jgi:hypothetical protein
VEEEKKGGPCEEADVFARGLQRKPPGADAGQTVAHLSSPEEEGCLMASLALGMVVVGPSAAAARGSFPAARSTELGRLGSGVVCCREVALGSTRC